MLALFCDPGFESTCLQTLTRAGLTGKTAPGCVLVDPVDKKKTIELHYTTPWTTRILVDAQCMDSVATKALNDFTYRLPDWCAQGRKFKVRAHGFDDNDATARFVGGALADAHPDNTVDLSDSDITIWVVQTSQRCTNNSAKGDSSDAPIIIGIDITGFEMQKRDYRIYLNPCMLRSTLAAAVLIEGGFDADKILVDPFCGSGTICIEAALMASGKSPFYYSKQRYGFARAGFAPQETIDAIFSSIDERIDENNFDIHGFDALIKRVRASTHNAKIAGVLDMLNFSRVDADWLDTRFSEKSVDLIITHPPLLTDLNKKKMLSVIADFLGQATRVLSENGTLLLLTNDASTLAEQIKEHGLTLDVHPCWMGQQRYDLITAKR